MADVTFSKNGWSRDDERMNSNALHRSTPHASFSGSFLPLCTRTTCAHFYLFFMLVAAVSCNACAGCGIGRFGAVVVVGHQSGARGACAPPSLASAHVFRRMRRAACSIYNAAATPLAVSG